jgi:mono/diheme cytochrome c family protein
MAFLLAACDNEQATGSNQPASTPAPARAPEPMVKTPAIKRSPDMAQIARGGKLYQQNCAACHGADAEGAPNWQQQGPDGKWPAPALNGTAHAWHHPMAILKRTIRDGTEKIGGSMPAWGDKLSEQEMDDIIAWFQARWPDELYTAWYRMDQQARATQ